MIAENQKITIERSGVSREGKFTVKSGAHIMRILRDKIYSNKVLACLREYSTNAWEAHRLNGNENTPIEITLPNLIDPMLKIRDFGPGLTFDQIEKLICSYGETTKDNSNEFAGCFGIGSKAAFSYSNTFQITSICNGSKVIANAYIDETEEGRLSELFYGPASDGEKSGIEIAIPVQLGDFNTFVTEAKNLFRFWDLPPIVKGHASYAPMVNTWYLRNPVKDWGFLDKEGYYATPYIVMGGIAYRLDKDKISNLDGIHERIIDKSLVIFAKIGDVTIAANREEVDYTPKTISFVKEFIRKIEIEAKAEIDTEFAKCVTEYEVKKLLHSYFKGGEMDNVMTQLFSGDYHPKFGAGYVTSSLFNEDSTRMNKIHEFYCRYSRGYHPMRSRMGTSIDLFSFDKIKLSRKPTNGYLFYYVGTEDFAKVNKLMKYYIKELNGGSFNEQHTVINFKTEQDKLDWCAEKGIPDGTFVDLFSTVIIPKKPRKPREPREANPKTNCAVFDPEDLISDKDRQYFDNGGWRYCDIDLENPTLAGPHYYVIKHYSNIFLDVAAKNNNLYGDNTRVSEVIKMLCVISQDFKDNMVVYAFNESELVKFKDNPDWIPLKDFAKDELQVQHDKFDGALIPVNHCGFNRESLILLKLINNSSFKLDNPEITSIINSFDFSEDTQRIATYDNLVSLLKIDPKGYSQEIITKMRTLIEIEEKNYPLLVSLRYYSDDELPEILLYLNAKRLQLQEKIAQEAKKVVDSTVKTSDDNF